DRDLLPVEVLRERDAEQLGKEPRGGTHDDMSAEDDVRAPPKSDGKAHDVQHDEAKPVADAGGTDTVDPEGLLAIEAERTDGVERHDARRSARPGGHHTMYEDLDTALLRREVGREHEDRRLTHTHSPLRSSTCSAPRPA